MPYHLRMSKQLELFIITGASKGMGQAMALQLLAADHEVLTMSRSQSEALQKTATAGQYPLVQWSLDLSDPLTASAQLRQWLAEQDASRYRSATLINNAGVIPAIAPLSQLDSTAISNAMRVGLEAPMLLTSAFLAATEHWSAVSRKVLNISSGLGRRAIASQACYCTAKAGVDQFSSSVALDEALKPHGAKICSLAPGVIDTDMQVHLRSASTESFPELAKFQQLKAQDQLTSAEAAAARVLAWLDRADFGEQVIADVRKP